MGTRNAAFTAKIKSLHDIQLRLMQSAIPLPTGNEIANNLKYFNTTLLGVLKDVPGHPIVMMRNRDNDVERMALFPNLDYKGLYSTLIQLLDLFPLIQSNHYDFGRSFLNVVCGLVPFLERELVDTLPYIVASSLTVFPVSLHEEVIDVLCWNLLPFTVQTDKPTDNFVLPDDGEIRRENYASNSASAILMMVFQFVKDNSAVHRKITECLMSLKEDLAKDILCVIAHGTPNARIPAANLLFYFWPGLNPTHYDRRTVLGKFNNGDTWNPPNCCTQGCENKAVKMCLEHSVSLSRNPEYPPISFFCGDCYMSLDKDRNLMELYRDINHPIKLVDITCENKNCRANEKMAVSTCFSNGI